MQSDFSAVLTPRTPNPPAGSRSAGPWQVTLDAPSHRVFHGEGLTAVLRGQLYGLDGPGLLQLYRQHGTAGLGRFDGAFTLLLLDETGGTALAVTDRAGTHRLYAAYRGGQLTVSTSPRHPDFTWRPYNPAALASVMVSGSAMNGLTLHQGVQSLAPASVHTLHPGGVTSQVYWAPPGPEPLNRRPEAELREEFGELLRRAVRRRTAGVHGPVHLSLSGGHDSRGLLSLLAAEGVDLRTFSYTQGPQASRSDTRTAQALAAQYGARHHTVQAYRGDLLATVRRNARWGHGVTNFCDEADAWDALAGPHFTHIFTGDEIHEVHGFPLSVPELLIKRHLRPFSTLGHLTRHLTPAGARVLEEAWAAETAQVQERLERLSDPYQQELALLARQVTPYRLMPWRERFAGRVAAVHLPYLDGAVMDFVHHLPPAMLAGKRLFIDTLAQLDPQLYRVPLARSQGYETDWNAELIRHRGAVKEDLLAGSSRLDPFITPQAIGAAIDDLTLPAHSRRLRVGQVRQVLGSLRRSQAAQRVLGRARLKAPAVPPALWLLRVLTLRALDRSAGH